MANDFDDIMERIKRATATRTQVELAALLGIRQSSISDAKRRKSVPADWYMKLLRTHGLNPEWLEHGLEPVYLRQTDLPRPPGVSEAAGRSGDSARPRSRPVQVVGMTERTNEVGELMFEPQGEISIPEEFFRQTLLVVRMDGTSMEPLIRKGAFIGLDREQRRVLSGEVYGVHIPFEGLVIKRVYFDAENGRYILRSENKNHPECSIPAESSDKQIIGRVVWVLQEI